MYYNTKVINNININFIVIATTRTHFPTHNAAGILVSNRDLDSSFWSGCAEHAPNWFWNLLKIKSPQQANPGKLSRNSEVCMGEICQLFVTNPDLNLIWIRNRIIYVIMPCVRPLPWAKCWQHMSGVKIIHQIFVLKWCLVVLSSIIAPYRCFRTCREQSGFQGLMVSWRRCRITSHR